MAERDDLINALSSVGLMRPEDLVNALAQPSTADVMAQYRPPQWGGLKSYLPDQPDWMKTAQGYAGQAMAAIPPEAMLAMNFLGRTPPAARAPQMAGPAEWPVHAAVKLGDQTFTGPSHMHAINAASDRLGNAAVDALLLKSGNSADGFVTNTGRYVTREEAGQLADQHNATRHYQTIFGNPRQGKDAFLSEALELYDPRTGLDK